MINAMHLIWIVPCSMLAGLWLAAMLSANECTDDRREWKED